MQIITYLTFGGNCDEAMNFYKEAIGAEILQVFRMGDSPMEIPENLKDKIMHARVQIGENILYMSDTFDPSSLNTGNNISLSIQIDNTSQIEKIFDGLSKNGTVKMPLQKTYWAEMFGMVVDKFGINWLINYELSESGASEKKKPH